MKRLNWEFKLGILLIASSALLYFIQYVIFKDAYTIFVYLLGSIAFLPLQVFLVTVIINKLLGEREKQARLEKLNMVVGAFFSEVGTKLLTYFSDFDPNLDKISKELVVNNDWTDKEFNTTSVRLKNYDYKVEIKQLGLKDLRSFLVGKRDFMLRLLENPNLPEHEKFTDLLRAVFHLTEELESRKELDNLPKPDEEHIAGDIKRAYVLLVWQWLDYMKYLKRNYPYLFSLAMRTNPFDEKASPFIGS